MADVETRVELTCLLDFYGPLLTEHRREVLRLYCEEDLSLAEIAEQEGISRQGVRDNIKRAEGQLLEMEEALHCAARFKQMMQTFSEVTEVEFAELTDDEISYYVEKYRPLDKAGAYGIQEWIGYIGIKGIKGDYYNVMGLPLRRVYEHLLKM